MDRLIDQSDVNDVPAPWLWRGLVSLEARLRPLWGWGVFITCMLLAMLPAVAVRTNRWLDLDSFQNTLEITGPLAVATVWLLWGWRRQERAHFGWPALLSSLSIGFLLMSQLLLGWLPGPRALWQAAVTGNWLQVPLTVVDVWMRAATRFALWREGVSAGGAAQDNLVFACLGAAILWLLGTLVAWLARGVRQGFAAGAPALWLIGVILLYSASGRYLLLTGLALTLALHILLDQGVLMKRWQQLGLDYSPGLLTDRFLAVLSAAAVIFTVAAVMPNLYIQPLVDRYYALVAPAHLALEEFGERLFPDLRGTSRLRGGSGGMPNEFLLRGGPSLGSATVMRVRTDEAIAYQYPFDEMAPPPAHYMRGRTLTVYDGRGWSNPQRLEPEQVAANRRWDEAEAWGRKQVVQSIILDFNSTVLFAAPEPVESSADVRLERRGADDLVTVQAREGSYTVVSMVPAVSEETLRSLPAWALSSASNTTNPVLPEAMAIHLALPESVSERTRELAQQLVEGRTSSYDKALAIEQYLRQYVYDLEVPEPPDDVTDVADYFLFELQRGYCDYYATAFVVLARLAGLPTRFATGYATGAWNPAEGIFVIRESDAHSWPEVYFPQVGWIPFEPTAGRSELLRVGLPQTNTTVVPPPIVEAAPVVADDASWNWQLLFWLIPVAGLLWLAMIGWQWWWRRREDPWQTLLQWGSRIGRPIGVGETVLEYGAGLSGYILARQHNMPDAGRIAAREIQALSEQVNRMRYAQADERLLAKAALRAHWERLRNYLRLIRVA